MVGSSGFTDSHIESEHRMTLLEAIRLYPKAIGWSMLISTCIVMEGFDVALIGKLTKASIK